jgi:C4-dicarboxylate transporter DctM subunit
MKDCGCQETVFTNSLVGTKTGGRPFSSAIFASLSGSAIANVAATGSITIPLMKKNGYSKGFAGAIEVSSSSLGAVIPPSLPFVVYGGLTSISIGSLFVGGYLPSIIMVLGILIILIIKAKDTKSLDERATRAEKSRLFVRALPAMLTPLIIIGGIFSGIMTPTESGAVGCVYALIVSFFYKELNFRAVVNTLKSTASTTGYIMLVMSSAALFGWVMAFENIPMRVAEAMVTVFKTPSSFMIGVVLLCLVIGMFIDTLSAIIIIGPVLVGASSMLGIDPLHFGLIFCISLTFGVLTPPVGTCLYVAAGIAETTVEDVAKHTVPFAVLVYGITLVLALLPDVTLWLPRVFGYLG